MGRKIQVQRSNAGDVTKPGWGQVIPRRWLLGSTTMVAGAFGAAGFVLMPSAALAGCTPAVNEYSCVADTSTPQSLSIGSGTFLVNFGVTNAVPADEEAYYVDANSFGMDALDINLTTAGLDGTINFNNTDQDDNFQVTEVINDRGNGVVLDNAGGDGEGGLVTVNIDTLIEGGAHAQDSDPLKTEPGDAFDVNGYQGTLTFDIGPDGQLIGADDGLMVKGVDGAEQFSVFNAGDIAGRGLSNDDTNDSEGIHVSTNGEFGPAADVEGGVSIYNQGFVLGSPNQGASEDDDIQYNPTNDANGGGQGISVSAQGPVAIYNNTVAAAAGLSDFSDNPIAGVAVIVGSSGIIATSEDGVSIYNNAPDGHAGGLIVGFNGDGVNVNQTDKDVLVNNDGTYTPNGTAIYDALGMVETNGQGTSEQELLDGVEALGPNAELEAALNDIVTSRGIWGVYDGVGIYDITGGNVDVENQDGLVVGIEGNAVDIQDVHGLGDSDVSSPVLVQINNQSGFLLGGFEDGYGSGINIDGVHGGDVAIDNELGAVVGNEDGVDIDHVYSGSEDGSHMGGGVGIDNTGGLIVGGSTGISISHVSSAEEDDSLEGVSIDNTDGDIVGYSEDGIDVHDAENRANDEDLAGYYAVTINNGLYNDGVDGGDGGVIYGARSAIDLDVQSALISNSSGGAIIGDGSYHSPVIDVRTGWRENEGAAIDNFGLITSSDAPVVTEPEEEGFDDVLPVTSDISVPTVDWSQLTTDIDNFEEYAGSAGQHGSTVDFSNYAEAAADVAVESSGGSLAFDNYGTLIGRVSSRGASEDGDGNTLVNFGTWLTTNDGWHGNSLTGEDGGEIDNAGLIQTSFATGTPETASFDVESFYNGSYWDSSTSEYVAAPTGGLISALDGEVGDLIKINGNFTGASPSSPGTSLVGLDTDFDPATPETAALFTNWGSQSDWRSDRFFVNGTVDGSTGLVIDGTGQTNVIGDTIIVAGADNVGTYDSDTGTHAFYIAPESKNYINVNGTGAVEDGLYAWYLHKEDVSADPDYVLQSDWAPQAAQLPNVITGAQNIWYESEGEVGDHVYDGEFAPGGEGGAGADLSVGATPTTAAPAPGSTLWGKIIGAATNESSSVTTGGMAGTVDTSFLQKTFALLGGADFQPAGDASGFRMGAFAGYESSNLAFSSFGLSADYTGGTLGGYASYTNGDFYADGEAKADVLGVTYTLPGSGISTTGTSTTAGATANVGYHMDFGSNFVEPLATLSFNETALSGFTGGGATVAYSNGQSLRAGAGLRVGTTVQTPKDTTTELAVLGKVWNEFEPSNSVTLTPSGGGAATTFSDGISGVFGEVDATATTYSTDHTLSGFVSVGDQFGSSFNTVDGKAGVNKSF